jgi:deoxyribodipyrimidine photo-lyase
VNAFWFRRDLRLNDNVGLFHALSKGKAVLPVFIFDTNILNDLEDKADARVEFIYQSLQEIQKQLKSFNSSLYIFYGTPVEAWKQISNEFEIENVFTNNDYEPYAIKRDNEIREFLKEKNINFHSFKDHVIFEKNEVIKKDGSPYLVFTPYSLQWKNLLDESSFKNYPSEKYLSNFFEKAFHFPGLKELDFKKTNVAFPDKIFSEKIIADYNKTRDFPAQNGTSRLSIHLRFGTISIRELTRFASKHNEKFLNELIWRDFYQMIIFHFPNAVTKAFRPEYDFIAWRNDKDDFEKWCNGKTGFPIVDAGMRELNATGYMHNRIRMITASFLTKDLLIDWRWGEAYFAKRLLDYDLASNNGGWQWSAGTGVDAAPYFRIFNPSEQAKKFDGAFKYIRKWIPELDSFEYPQPMIDHHFARDRALKVYKDALAKKKIRS